MLTLTKACLAMIFVIHAGPSLPLFFPKLIYNIYGLDPSGEIGLLLRHRACLFLIICIAALFAIYNPYYLRISLVIFSVSILCFLMLYFCAGMPEGSLRKIALADLLCVPLLFYLFYIVCTQEG